MTHQYVARIVWLLALVFTPLIHWVFYGSTVWITNTTEVNVKASLLTASSYLQCAQNLNCYEQKVTGCNVIGQQF
eukprot:Pgem_evm1s6103